MITLEQFVASEQLAGSCEAFADLSTWQPWLAFGRAAHGLELDEPSRNLYGRCTRRRDYAPPEGGYREVVAITGRQSGKTRFASALVAFVAATHPPVRDGNLYALLLAQDARAAQRAAFSYVCAIFDASPALSGMVTNRTADTLTLENGVRIAVYPCRPASIRGLRACVAVCDELAFFRSTEFVPQDSEMLRALRPTLATTGGRLVVLSSPYGQSGALWDLHRRHHGREDSPTLVWQASATMMNPGLPRDYLARMQDEDPEAFQAEVLGEFRAGLSTLLDPAVIDEAVVPGRRELPPLEDTHYAAFVDPSGGRRDAFTCAIGHRDGERAVVDALRRWPAPFNPSGVVAECAELVRGYGCALVTGDRYAGEFAREPFRAAGVGYDLSPKDRSGLYLGLLAALNSRRVELPEDATLVRELRGLERRRGTSGRDRVDHAPGAHDDSANAAAGLVELLVGRSRGLSPSESISAMETLTV